VDSAIKKLVVPFFFITHLLNKCCRGLYFEILLRGKPGYFTTYPRGDRMPLLFKTSNKDRKF
jgi:hypothetical protein